MVKISGKISSKRQFTLPIKIMRALNINPGDKVTFVKQDGENFCKLIPEETSLSASELHTKFAHLPKIIASVKQIKKAREDAHSKKF